MATIIALSNFPPISAEYAPNILPYASTFNQEMTYSITGGDLGGSLVENSALKSLSGKRSLRVYSDNALSLNFNGGTAFNFTVTEEKPILFKLFGRHVNLAGDDPTFLVHVYTNGVLTETMVKNLYYEEPHIELWNDAANVIPAKTINDVISFTFEFISGNAGSEVFIDGWKMEYDYMNKGIPTAYTEPELLPVVSTQTVGSVTAGSTATFTVSVPYALDGDIVLPVGTTNAIKALGGKFDQWVSAAGTVTVKFTNDTVSTINLPSAKYTIEIKK